MRGCILSESSMSEWARAQPVGSAFGRRPLSARVGLPVSAYKPGSCPLTHLCRPSTDRPSWVANRTPGLPAGLFFRIYSEVPLLARSFVQTSGDPSFLQHCRDMVEASDARVHFHRLVQAIGVGSCVSAPAAFAHHISCEVEVEGLADARLDA